MNLGELSMALLAFAALVWMIESICRPLQRADRERLEGDDRQTYPFMWEGDES